MDISEMIFIVSIWSLSNFFSHYWFGSTGTGDAVAPVKLNNAEPALVVQIKWCSS